VEIVLPQGVKPVKVKLLTAGSEQGHTVRDDILTLSVPGFPLHEVVAVDLQ
jgi:hypothetical protein